MILYKYFYFLSLDITFRNIGIFDFPHFAFVKITKHIEIKSIPSQPIGANFSPTNIMANIAATKGSNKVKVIALLAGTVFKPNPNNT